jgi:hypothetical protein
MPSLETTHHPLATQAADTWHPFRRPTIPALGLPAPDNENSAPQQGERHSNFTGVPVMEPGRSQWSAAIGLTAPRLRVRGFSVSSTPASPTHSRRSDTRPDKSKEPRLPSQDSALSVSSFASRTEVGQGGVDIDLEASTLSTTLGHAGLGSLAGLGAAGIGLAVAALAGSVLTGGLVAGVLLGGAVLGGLIGGAVGEYRFTQTIDTNAPRGGVTSPYVDPRPNDDTKPFYYTDAEEQSSAGRFHDSPTRPVPGGGITRWDAVCSIAHVSGKSVTILDSLKYGFSIDTANTVAPRSPVTASGGDVGGHVATLRSEFPDWTFGR